MTLGENIRRIRKERGLTIKQLGQKVGVSESYMRAYEVGERNPKQDKIEKIAIALGVNPETLQNSEFDAIRAMHRLFQIFRQYGGELFENEDEYVCIKFSTLQPLLGYWKERYDQYQKELEECDTIKNPHEKAARLIEIENEFWMWMDVFPEQVDQGWLEHEKNYDAGMDYMSLHPLNDPENPMTEEEKRIHNLRAKALFEGKEKPKKKK